MTLSEQEQRRFLRTLQDDPAFLAQVRSLILPAELVQLPELFAEFVSQVTAFIERQEKSNARLEDSVAEQGESIARLEKSVAQLEESVAEQATAITQQAESIARLEKSSALLGESIARLEKSGSRHDESIARLTNRLQRITDDLGDLKGHVAGRVAREMADDIAERFGFEIIQLLNGNDLRIMLRQQRPDDISPGTRRSFYLADMVAKVEDQDGNQLYIAAEASYTADERDTRRAVRNAGFLTRFTGIDAVPVIASRDNDHAVQRMVDDGAIRWFQFEARDLQPQ